MYYYIIIHAWIIAYFINQKYRLSNSNTQIKDDNYTKSIINERYSNTAKQFDLHSKEEQDKLRSIANVFGYSTSELEDIGKDANLGLGCGNPVKSQYPQNI